jgi:nucleoside-diphosphate-sugar epimerase
VKSEEDKYSDIQNGARKGVVVHFGSDDSLIAIARRVAFILLLAEKASCKAEVYNLASGIETTIREFADLILAQLGHKIPIEFDGNIFVGNPSNWRSLYKPRLAELALLP